MINLIITYTAVFYAGALWGSFFVTLALRFADNTMARSPLKGLTQRSHCPRCKAPVSAAGLIPIFGYAIIKGRCSYCKSKIPVIYPLFEICYGIIVLIIFIHFGLSVYSILTALLAGIGGAITVVDFKTMRIPDSLVISFAVLSIYPAVYDGRVSDNLYGLLFLGGFFLIILFIFPGGFGAGDMKFAAVIGFNLGFSHSIVALEIALISGAIIGLFYALISGRGLRIKIPFGPFLYLSYLITVLRGNDILLLYMNLAGGR